LNTFVSGEYYPAFCGPLTKEEILGTPAKKESLFNYHSKQTHTMSHSDSNRETRKNQAALMQHRFASLLFC